MLSELQTGDEIVTTGGIYGTITNVKDDRFVIRVADNTNFWFEDIYNNPEIVPTPTPEMRPQNKPGRMVKVDETTVRWEFDVPYSCSRTSWPAILQWVADRPSVRPPRSASALMRRPLPEAVPAEIFLRRGGECSREAGGIRELGADAALQEGLGTQPRGAGSRPVAQCAADQQPDLAAGAESVLLRG